MSGVPGLLETGETEALRLVITPEWRPMITIGEALPVMAAP
ncbi:hypothetical protein ABZ934_24735 [Streptomyces sp. NPDC046557]